MFERGHPHEEGHAFDEGPLVVGEEDLDAVVFVVVDEVEVGDDVSFL